MAKSIDRRQGADARLGETVENYSLLSVLGTGSTSTVYLAQRLDDTRSLAAVKILSYHAATQASDRASFRARFLREARAVSKLRNEHILPVLSFGDTDDMTYMVMPVVVGGTLGVRLVQEGGPLPLREIVEYMNQLADALDYAHKQGLVHRDVKPSNILIDEHRHLYLTDFGIARMYDNGENALTREGTLTGTGQILGTPYYMAPEQITGGTVGPTADVYATGVVLYQLVTGQVPFPGDTPLAVALQHLQETPSSPQLLREELPDDVADVILKAMEKKPAARFQSVGALAEAFSKTLTSSSALAQPGSSTWPFATTYGTRSMGQISTTADELDPQLAGIFDEVIGTRVGAYRVELLREADAHSARFVARREGASTPFQLRLVVPPQGLGEEEQEAFRDEVAERIETLAALDDPRIEEIADSGVYLGMPYVVTPAAPGKTLADLLAAKGAMEPSLIAGYLAQVSAALAYAQEHGAWHLNLSPASVVVRGENDVLLTDFALDADGEAYAAVAPEQLLGQPVGAYTDVYALGNTLYQMLTAHPVFDGNSRDDIAQQHLNSTIPPARTWRAGLPAGIENVLARAMAKEPEYRYASPQELVTAYQKVLARANGLSSTSAATGAALTGMGGRSQVTKLAAAPQGARPGASASRSIAPARSTTTARRPVASTNATVMAERDTSRGREDRTVMEPLAGSTASGLSRRRVETQIGSPMATTTGTSIRRLPQARPTTGPILPSLPSFKNRMGKEVVAIAAVVGIVALTLVLLNAFHAGGGAHVVAAPTGPNAVVHFFDGKNSAGTTDALNITVSDLPAPPQGSSYDAWMVDDAGEHFLALGSLKAAEKGWTLAYDGSTESSGAGTNLLGFGDKMEVTQETGAVTAPQGKVVLTGTFPPTAFSHIRHLVFSFTTTPGQKGFLVGLLQQSTVMDQQAQSVLTNIQRGYTTTARCYAQSVVDVIEGSSGENYKPLDKNLCVDQRNITEQGDGFGITGSNGYLEGAADHASLAAHSDDASDLIKLHSTHISNAITNVTGWVTTLDQDALNVVNGNFDLTKAQELAALADKAVHGVDANGNEMIDPIIGEAGVVTAYTHGQLLAELDLAAPTTHK